MLIYIPSEQNSGLFDAYCGENAIPFTRHPIRKLSEFVESSISNLTHVTTLAFDLAALDDTDDELISAVMTLQSMYAIRIIAIALGRQPGNALLGRLFHEGIYNIITAENPEVQRREIAACLSDNGMLYKDAVRFRLQEEEKEPEPQKHFFRTPKPKAKPKPAREILPTPPIPQSKPPGQKPPLPPIREPPQVIPEPAPQVIERVVYKTEVRRLKQTVTIGICGTQRRVGTTHQALLLCRFLTESGYQAAYLESNDHGAVEAVNRTYLTNTNHEIGLVQFSQVNLFTGFSLPTVMALKYDFYIFDYGSFEETPLKEFLSGDVKLIVGCTKAWELISYSSIFQALNDYPDVSFLMNFVPEDEQDDIRELMGVYGAKTFFSDYAPSPFSADMNTELYNAIFGEYLTG